jgi:hypothetical protein
MYSTKVIFINKEVKVCLTFLFLIFFYNLYLSYVHYDPVNFFTGDGVTYKELSEKLFNEFKYYEDFPIEYPYRAWRTPGYPFFLFFLKFFSIETANEIFVLNQFFLISTYLILLKIIFLCSPKTNLLNLFLILIIYISHINDQFLYYIHNHNEPFYIFLIALGIYLIIKSLIVKKERFLIFGLLVLSFSCLVRTPTLSITTLVLIILYISTFFKIINISSKKIILYSAIFYIFPLLWMIRNYYVLDHFPFFLGSQSTHLLLGTFRYIDWEYIDTFAYDRIVEFKDQFEIIRPSLITEAAISRILEDPIYYINSRIINFLRYLINNYSFFSLALIPLFLFKNLSFRSMVKKSIKFASFKNNFLIIYALAISIIFLIEMSFTFYVPRYGIIPSIFIMLFANILIIKILEFNKYKI